MQHIPDPVERPKLAVWLWSRKLKAHQVAASLGVSAEQVRRYCLEFGHPDRSVPGPDVLVKIDGLTSGAVTERDFYPPHIRGDALSASAVDGAAPETSEEDLSRLPEVAS